MDVLSSLAQGLLGLLSLGCFSFLPHALALAAIVDVLRSGAQWYWIPVVLLFPVVGPAAYFLLVRSPWAGASGAVSPEAARRQHARRRLRELRVQLAHWQGPGVLAEAGEHLLVLGRVGEAERHLRAAREAGADPTEVALPLARVLEAGKRWDEAVPLLEELVRVAPPYRLADAWLHLARCRDEGSASDEATEQALRGHLERGTGFEARVRLARLLLRRGERGEAERLLAGVETDYRSLPRYLRRVNAPWRRAARRLGTGHERLPRPHRPAGRSRVRFLWAGAAAAAVLVLAVMVGLYALFAMRMREMGDDAAASYEAGEAVRRALERLDEERPWTRGDDLAAVELTAEDVDRYLRVRRALVPALSQAAAARARAAAEAARYQERIADGGVAGALVEMLFSGEGVGSVGAWIAGEAAFREGVHAALEAEELGPSGFGRLAAIVEWRFLGREELLLLGIPTYYRADYLRSASEIASNEETVELYGDSEEDAEWLAEVRVANEQIRARQADLEARARREVDLAPATRRLLESRREELEALPRDGLRYLPHAADRQLPWIDDL
jgi:hypothetical protein